MEPVPFKYLSHAEFFELTQEQKASYLIAAVRELAKITAILVNQDQQNPRSQAQALPGTKPGQ